MSPSSNLSCEVFETSLSALIDGELEVPEQLPVVDHLLECASCREFYRQARALGGMADAAASQHAAAAPEEVWERIATETGLATRSRPQAPDERRLLPPWPLRPLPFRGALQAAAVVLFALGFWFLRPVFLDAPGPAAAEVDVVLEEDRGAMSDERFLELTTEVLRADRSYHRKMLEVMSVVTDMVARPEGSGDEPAATAGESLRRISVGEDDGEEASLWSSDRL